MKDRILQSSRLEETMIMIQSVNHKENSLNTIIKRSA